MVPTRGFEPLTYALRMFKPGFLLLLIPHQVSFNINNFCTMEYTYLIIAIT